MTAFIILAAVLGLIAVVMLGRCVVRATDALWNYGPAGPVMIGLALLAIAGVSWLIGTGNP